MDVFIRFTTIIIVIAYVVFAVWFIYKRRSLWASVGSAVGLICGGVVIVPVAEAIATFLCWMIAIAIVSLILGAFCG